LHARRKSEAQRYTPTEPRLSGTSAQRAASAAVTSTTMSVEPGIVDANILDAVEKLNTFLHRSF
jgi:hypothetical protein